MLKTKTIITNTISPVSNTFLILLKNRFLASYLSLGLIHFWSRIVTRAYNLAIPIQKLESTNIGITLILWGLCLRWGINFIPLPTIHKTTIETASIQWFKYNATQKAIGPINTQKSDMNLSIVKNARYGLFHIQPSNILVMSELYVFLVQRIFCFHKVLNSTTAAV